MTSLKPSPSCRTQQCGTGQQGIPRGRLSQVLGLTAMKHGTAGCRSEPSCRAQPVPAPLRSPWSPRGHFLSAPGTGQTQSRRGCTLPGTHCSLRVPVSTPSLAPAPQPRGLRPHQGQLCHPLFLEELSFLPHLQAASLPNARFIKKTTAKNRHSLGFPALPHPPRFPAATT